MANSDYSIRSTINGYCPAASLASDMTALQSVVTMTGYSSPIPNGITVGMAAIIEDEIVVVLGRSVDVLNLGRGCCDTVPRAHPAGSTIWFFDNSFGNDAVEYGATETLSVKLLPRTISSPPVPIAYSPPNPITFNWRFLRPYPPGLLLVNGDPFDVPKTLTSDGVTSLTLTWAHRNRVTQQDALVDHSQATITPEAGTTYTVEVRKASDNSLVYSLTGLTGTTWSYDRSTAMSDFGVTGGIHNGYILLKSRRDGYDSYQSYRIDFVLNAWTKVSADRALSWLVLNTSPVSRDLALSWTVSASSGGYPSAAGFAALYRMEDGTGSTTIANSGSTGGSLTIPNDNSARLVTAAAKFGSGGLRRSRISGYTQIVDTKSAYRLAPGGALTCGAWMRKNGDFSSATDPSGTSESGGIIFMPLGGILFGPGRMFLLAQYTPANILEIQVYASGAGAAVTNSYHSQAAPSGSEHFVEFCIDAGAGVYYVFVNGTLVNSNTVNNANVIGAGAGSGSIEFGMFSTAGSADPSYPGRNYELDNIFLINGSCIHTASYTPPGDF